MIIYDIYEMIYCHNYYKIIIYHKIIIELNLLCIG